MDEKEKLDLIYRIVSGYTFIECSDLHIIDTPTDKLINEANHEYIRALMDSRFDEFLPEQDIIIYLIRNKLWSFKQEKELKELDKSLEDCKVQLYKMHNLPAKEQEGVRKQIALIKEKKIQQLSIRHSLDMFIGTGYAHYISDLFLFSKCVLNKNYRPIALGDLELSFLYRHYKSKTITLDKIREISRTEPWRSLWRDAKFRRNGEEQQTLSLFTRMYTNVYEHPERPLDNVIADDDMLDGWFIVMKEKSEKEHKESSKNLIEQKHRDASDIFIFKPPENDKNPLISKELEGADFVKEVMDFNDMRGKIIQARIHKGVQQQEIVRDMDIPEIRTEILERARNG